MDDDDDELQNFIAREYRIVNQAMRSIEALEEYKSVPTVGNDGEARLGWFWRVYRRPIPQAIATLETRSECLELIRTRLREPFFRLQNLSDVRAGVIVHAALAIGVEKVIGNRDLWAALEAENYERAQDVLLRTDWPALVGENDQERTRLLALVRAMRTGEAIA